MAVRTVAALWGCTTASVAMVGGLVWLRLPLPSWVPVALAGLVLYSAIASAALLFWSGVYRRRVRLRIAQGPTVLLLPRTDLRPVDMARLTLWDRLGRVLPRGEWLSWELGGHRDAVQFALHASSEALEGIMVQVRAEWPGTHRREAKPDLALLPPGWQMYWVEIVPRTWDRPLEPVGDAVRTLLLELSRVDGRGLVQVLAWPDRDTGRRLLRQALRARNVETRSRGVRAVKADEARRLANRARRPLWQVTVRCVGVAPRGTQARHIAHRLARAVMASFTGNPLRIARQGRNPAPVLQRHKGRKGVWSSAELAYLAHLVGRDAQALAPRLLTAPARSLPAPPEMHIARARTAAVSFHKEA